MRIYLSKYIPRRDGFAVSVPAFTEVGRGFASQPGHTKYHHKMV